MNKKAYIDWLNGMVDIKKREIALLQKFIDEGKVGNQAVQDRLTVELNIFQICLNHIKGR
jgi:hypothetical protein